MIESRRIARREAGASHVEVVAAALLLALVLVPMMDALRLAGSGADQHQTQVVNQLRMTSKLEDVLAQPMSALLAEAVGVSTPSSFSDDPSAGYRRIVYLSPYDADNADGDNDPFTGTEDDLVWVRVVVEGTPLAVETLATR